MPRFFNARRSPEPAAGTSHGVVHSSSARRLLVSTQFGRLLDGSLPEALDAEIEAAWSNLQAVLTEGGMGIADLVRLVTYVVDRDTLALTSRIRRQKLGAHAPACSDLIVQGLSAPGCRIALEAEAVSEDGVPVLDVMPDSMSLPGSKRF
jgi:enamine deaminase RidA (YjgF/YER057c/UK114 family)